MGGAGSASRIPTNATRRRRWSSCKYEDGGRRRNRRASGGRPGSSSGSWVGASTPTPRWGWSLAGIIAVLLVHGGPAAFRWSFLLMVVATLVDATDGTLARRVRIKEAVPSFDGRRLDDIIDFLTYTFLPLLLIYRAGILPAGYEAWLFSRWWPVPTASARSRPRPTTAISSASPRSGTSWRVYLYALPFGSWVSLAIVVVLALLTFVPSRYLYPSLPGKFNRFMSILGIPWTFGWSGSSGICPTPPRSRSDDARGWPGCR